MTSKHLGACSSRQCVQLLTKRSVKSKHDDLACSQDKPLRSTNHCKTVSRKREVGGFSSGV